MKIISLILLTLCTLFSLSKGAEIDPTKLPMCALICQGAAITNTTCSPTNVPCLCQDAIFVAAVGQCVQATCTVKEALLTQRLSSRQCGVPIHPRDPQIAVIRDVFISISAFFIVIRIFVKCSHWGGKWWWDDYLIIAAFVILVGLSVDTIFEVKFGLGTDIWDLESSDITRFLIAFFVIAPLYKAQIGISKISVCFFFLRFFPSRNFKRYTIGVIVLNIVVIITFMTIDVFQCSPVHAAWTGWSKESPAKCLSITKISLGNSVVNIVLDFVMLILPIYEVSRLSLSWGRKISVAGMFAVGFILSITTILRIENFAKYLNTANPTRDYSGLFYWSIIECNISIICACLPDARVFVLRNIPSFLNKNNSTVKEGPKEWSPWPSNASIPEHKPDAAAHVKSVEVTESSPSKTESKPPSPRNDSAQSMNFLISGTGNMSPLQSFDVEYMSKERKVSVAESFPGPGERGSHILPEVDAHDELKIDVAEVAVLETIPEALRSSTQGDLTQNTPRIGVAVEYHEQNTKTAISPKALGNGFQKWEIKR